MKISETEVDYDGLHAFLEIIIWCVALMVCACTVTGNFDLNVTPISLNFISRHVLNYLSQTYNLWCSISYRRHFISVKGHVVGHVKTPRDWYTASY